MKKIISKTLVISAMLILSLSANGAINNLLSGDSYNFEGGTIGDWQIWGDNTPTGTTSAPGYNSSSYCLKLTNPTAGTDYYKAQAGLAFSKALETGKTYKLQFKAKSDAANSAIQFCFQNTTSYSGCNYTVVKLTTDWKTYSLDFDLETADMDRILFNFGKIADTFYIDEIEFGEEGEGPDTPIYINNLISGDSYDFEGGTLGTWQSWGDNNPTRTASAPGYNSSAYCMKLTNPSTGSDYYLAQAGLSFANALVDGKTYKMRFKAKASVATGAIQIMYQNSSTYDGGLYKNIKLTTDWKTYTIDVPISGTGINRIVISFGKIQGLYYIDEVEFGEEGTAPTPPGPTPTPSVDNLLSGDSYHFDGGTVGKWLSWGTNNPTKTVSAPGYNSTAYCMKLTNPTAATNYYDAQAGAVLDKTLENGKTYKVIFKAKASVADASIQCAYQSSESYEGGGYTEFNLTTDWDTYSMTVTVNKDNMDRLLFNFGMFAADYYIDEIEVGIEGSTPDPGPTPTPVTINNMLTGDSYNFDGGTKGQWNIWGDNNPTSEAFAPGYNGSAYCMKLVNPTTGSDYYLAQAGCSLPAALENGKTYKLQFKAKCSVADASIQFAYQKNSGDYAGGGYTAINITTEWATYTLDIEVNKDDMNRILINFGKVAGTYYFDEIEFGTEGSTPEPGPTPTLRGDVNGDGVVDVADITSVARIILYGE